MKKYYRLYPNDPRPIQRSMYAIHTGFTPDGRPLYTYYQDNGMQHTGIPSASHGLINPGNGLALGPGPPRGGPMPPPSDGWDAVSPLSPGELQPGPAQPPVTPPMPDDPQALGKWTVEKETAWLAWCKTVDERLARGGL